MTRSRISMFAAICALLFAGSASARHHQCSGSNEGAALQPGVVAVPAPSGHGQIICAPTEQRQPVAGHDMACGPVRVHFDTNSAALDEDAKTILGATARCLELNPAQKVSVAGGTDERGTAEYNLKLGDERAKAVSDFLAAQGVPSDRIAPLSIGKDHPLCSDSSEECFARNRRAAVMPSEIPSAAPQTTPPAE